MIDLLLAAVSSGAVNSALSSGGAVSTAAQSKGASIGLADVLSSVFGGGGDSSASAEAAAAAAQSMYNVNIPNAASAEAARGSAGGSKKKGKVEAPAPTSFGTQFSSRLKQLQDEEMVKMTHAPVYGEEYTAPGTLDLVSQALGETLKFKMDEALTLGKGN